MLGARIKGVAVGGNVSRKVWCRLAVGGNNELKVGRMRRQLPGNSRRSDNDIVGIELGSEESGRSPGSPWVSEEGINRQGEMALHLLAEALDGNSEGSNETSKQYREADGRLP